MGAICGIISLNGNPISADLGTKMMDNLKMYPLDDFGACFHEQAFLGNIIKYITPEDCLERLPYVDIESGLTITADAIIDNREELLSTFNIPLSDGCKMSDTEIITRAYLVWGEDCPKHLIGDFAFAIWNEKKKELFCARDHVGKRTLYFCHSSNMFAFCTLMKPLVQILTNPPELNDSWIAAFLALLGPIHEVDTASTIYKDIQQLPPAHSIRLTYEGVKKKQYWNPSKTPKLKLGSNEEYEEAFRKVFFEAVQCRLRSIGSVGIMLSGGLDSGSIACVAAKRLNEVGSRLKAFNSIPFPGYIDWLAKNAVADERGYIEAILEQYSNIDMAYCDSKGINSYNSIDELIGILEHPYKFVQNFFWINEIASQAEKSGCSILLDGQFGNFTISFGYAPSYLMSLFRQGKWLTILKEIGDYSRFYNIKYSNVLKYFIKMILPDYFRDIYHIFNRKRKVDDNFYIPVNPEFASRWKVDNQFKKAGLGAYMKKSHENIAEIHKFISNSVLFSQSGDVETKISLQYGLAKRDPSKDKRVIEFCMSIPIDQFVVKGVERSLIRRTMEGILPDKIRLNFSQRGYQSADWIQRLLPEWGNIQIELQKILKDEKFKKYFDFNKINKVLREGELCLKDGDNFPMQMVGICIVFRHFFIQQNQIELLAISGRR